MLHGNDAQSVNIIRCQNRFVPAVELICVGGAIFDTFKRFENSVESADSVACGVDKLLFVSRLIFGILRLDSVGPAVELPFDGIRNLLLGVGTIFDPCTRLTCRIIPSGAIT